MRVEKHPKRRKRLIPPLQNSARFHKQGSNVPRHNSKTAVSEFKRAKSSQNLAAFRHEISSPPKRTQDSCYSAVRMLLCMRSISCCNGSDTIWERKKMGERTRIPQTPNQKTLAFWKTVFFFCRGCNTCAEKTAHIGKSRASGVRSTDSRQRTRPFHLVVDAGSMRFGGTHETFALIGNFWVVVETRRAAACCET